MKDLTTLNTICGKIQEVQLITRMEKMDLNSLQKEFLSIIEDPTISASKETRYKWRDAYQKNKSKVGLMTTISNLYLAGAGMKLK